MSSDDALSPDRLVFWDEITRSEVTAYETALEAARDEGDMQRFLEAHPRMLVQHLTGARGAWVIPKKRLGSEYETDFVIAQRAPGGLVWLAVELERPQAKLFNKDGGQSAALTHAFEQIDDWRDWLSQNRDYASRPRDRKGLTLPDIDPELDGLIIMGRDADVDQRATAARRRRLERRHRVKIETYDWLLSQTNERLAALERARKAEVSVAEKRFTGELLASILNPDRGEPARRALEEIFGGTISTSIAVSAAREIDWEGVDLGPDYPDLIAPFKIIYARRMKAGNRFRLHDWIDWTEHVTSDLLESLSLLVTEVAPDESLQERLALERDGIWYAEEWLPGIRDHKPRLTRLSLLVHMPPDASYEEKRRRAAIARRVLLRFISYAGQQEIESAEIQVVSLAPGDRVQHNTFGFGTVVSTSGSGVKAEATIDFGEGVGVKHLVLRYAPLEKRLRASATQRNTACTSLSFNSPGLNELVGQRPFGS